MCFYILKIVAKKQKFYVVWEGKAPGIYHSWEECQEQIAGVASAKYKSFESLAVAQAALKGNYYDFIEKKDPKKSISNIPKNNIVQDSIAVDAACSGNPGLMEYQGVTTFGKKQIFHQGPFKNGTNNIGEFLALVHALALLQKKGNNTTTIYTDSKTAMKWVKDKKAKTKLEPSKNNQILFELIERAENWLKHNTYKNPILKWETESWGEIPADFGRK